MSAVDLLRALLPIDATTGAEQAITDHLAALLTERDYQLEMIPVNDRANLFAVFERPDVVLTTHLDTVPPHLDWHEDDEHFFGRGACDAKGCIAAMIDAADQLRATSTAHALLFVIEEETTSAGGRAAAKALSGRGIHQFIDGEPTQGAWVKATLGVLAARVTFAGTTAHSAYPERGHSAIHDLVETAARWQRDPMPQDPALGPSLLNLGTIEGGRAANVVADKAHLDLLARCTVPAEQVEAHLKATLPTSATWETRSSSDPQHLKLPPGIDDGEIVRFGSDVPFLSAVAPCAMYGPGSIHVAHASNESVSKQALIDAANAYAQAVRAFAQQYTESQ